MTTWIDCPESRVRRPAAGGTVLGGRGAFAKHPVAAAGQIAPLFAPLIGLAMTLTAAAQLPPGTHPRQAERNWRTEIDKLRAIDLSQTDPPGGVLLIGSSSIRLWDDAAQAMSPYPVIRRGYGGARYRDLAVFAEELIAPHDYRALVVFVGNDVSGTSPDEAIDRDRPADATAAEVTPWAKHIVDVSRKHQPDAPVLLVEITPTPVRFELWPAIRQINAALREVALTTPGVHFVATADLYLDDQKQPREELFRDDRLHQNEAGYELWAGRIKRELDGIGLRPIESP